ncbi:hypothetical protein DdX_19007 [Ditylenchus destructor]|uniref:Uncharacterized protein n=1 Tax=Ditylenchus destructor TaxID=166010 RepID=A0AAD4MK44_9BILA|nr:hypothetical protein DdX_19007 [Ditylenchus destructor]
MSETEPIRCPEAATQVDDLPDNLKSFITKFTDREIIVALPNAAESTISFPLIVNDMKNFSFRIKRDCDWSDERCWYFQNPKNKSCPLFMKWKSISDTLNIGDSSGLTTESGGALVTINDRITLEPDNANIQQGIGCWRPFESVPSCENVRFLNMSILTTKDKGQCNVKSRCNVTLNFPRPQVQFLGNFPLPPTTRPAKALTTKPTDSAASSAPYWIAGGVLLLLIVVGAVILVVCLYKRKRRRDVESPPLEGNDARTKADPIFSAADESYNKSVCVKKVYATNADNKQNGDNQATPKGQKSQSEAKKSTRTHSTQ